MAIRAKGRTVMAWINIYAPHAGLTATERELFSDQLSICLGDCKPNALPAVGGGHQRLAWRWRWQNGLSDGSPWHSPITERHGPVSKPPKSKMPWSPLFHVMDLPYKSAPLEPHCI